MIPCWAIRCWCKTAYVLLLEARIGFRDTGANLNMPDFEEKRDAEPGKLVCTCISKLKDIQHWDYIYAYYSKYLGFLYKHTLNSLKGKLNKQTNKTNEFDSPLKVFHNREIFEFSKHICISCILNGNNISLKKAKLSSLGLK